MTILSNITTKERARLAFDAIDDITENGSINLYLGIGHNQPWSANDTLVETPIETTDYTNSVYRNLCAVKFITVGDASIVVRRVDWNTGTFYDEYDENVQMYTFQQVSSGNGTVNVSNSTVIVGTNTTFLNDFAPNDILELPGDGISILPQYREVISIANNTQMTVNLAFTGNIVQNTPLAISNTYPFYAKNFYVRNMYDQVFLCLFNNFGAASTVMPTLSIGGNLPTNPFILTSDGYKWKYLYTIGSGQKQTFFTSEWMPVSIEQQVVQSAVDGRLDIIKINNGGIGYNNGAASFSAPILSVVGDGTGASLTAQVDSNGTITGVNILNGGEGYTTANIIIGSTGSNANLVAVIGPQGGWGSNAALHLGATNIMISVDLNNTEGNTIPTKDSLGSFFTYRQLSLISDPLLANNSTVANGLNYDMTTAIAVSANTPFAMNDLVYQSINGMFSTATFVGTVVWFDNSINELHINNVSGTFQPQTSLFGTKNANSVPYAIVTAFNSIAPTIQLFSGKLLYVENRSAVQRAPTQIENVKLVIGF